MARTYTETLAESTCQKNQYEAHERREDEVSCVIYGVMSHPVRPFPGHVSTAMHQNVLRRRVLENSDVLHTLGIWSHQGEAVVGSFRILTERSATDRASGKSGLPRCSTDGICLCRGTGVLGGSWRPSTPLAPQTWTYAVSHRKKSGAAPPSAVSYASSRCSMDTGGLCIVFFRA
jgi:hypothetical protein